MKNIKVAIVGNGDIANFHARGLKKLPGVEIAIAVDIQPETAKKFAAEYGIKEAGSDAMRIAGRDDIDAVIIGTPNKFHAPYALEFLNNRKDVFLEKPMAMSPQEGHKISEQSNMTGQLLMVGHMWRFDTEVNYLKKAVE